MSVAALSSATGVPPDTGSAVALQPDGRIVIAGTTGLFNRDFAVARLRADGTLDTEFTDTGVIKVDFFRLTDIAETVAITHDGKIVIAGQARDRADGYGIARLSPQEAAAVTTRTG